jgi:hypothetical protein
MVDSPTKLPIATRAAIAPHTAAMPALPRSVFVRSKLSLITGSSAAGAKVDTNAAKNASQLRWKAGKWGFEKYQGRITRDLCSVEGKQGVQEEAGAGVGYMIMGMHIQQQLGEAQKRGLLQCRLSGAFNEIHHDKSISCTFEGR